MAYAKLPTFREWYKTMDVPAYYYCPLCESTRPAHELHCNRCGISWTMHLVHSEPQRWYKSPAGGLVQELFFAFDGTAHIASLECLQP